MSSQHFEKSFSFEFADDKPLSPEQQRHLRSKYLIDDSDQDLERVNKSERSRNKVSIAQLSNHCSNMSTSESGAEVSTSGKALGSKNTSLSNIARDRSAPNLNRRLIKKVQRSQQVQRATLNNLKNLTHTMDLVRQLLSVRLYYRRHQRCKGGPTFLTVFLIALKSKTRRRRYFDILS